MVYFLRVWYNGINGIWLVNIRTAIVQIFYIKYIGRGEAEMKKTLAIIVVVILVLAGVLAVSYNGLAGDRESVDTAQADVDTMLQRRADLIPNLVSTVKSYAKHETEVFDKVLEARSQLMDAYTMEEKAEADQQSGSENRISVARKDYNDAVKTYNTKLVKFPGNILGSALGFEKAAYFEASASASENPDVGELLAE